MFRKVNKEAIIYCTKDKCIIAINVKLRKRIRDTGDTKALAYDNLIAKLTNNILERGFPYASV